MKKNIAYKFLLPALVFQLLLCACEDVVQVELSEENIDLIAVEAYLSTRSRDNVYVKLQKSLAVDVTDSNPPVNNAVVELFDTDSAEHAVFLEEYETSGVYQLPANKRFTAQTGRSYSLKITTEDDVEITASDYLAKVEALDTVKVHLSARGDYEYLAIFISSQETPGLGNYYKWDIYINSRLLYTSGNLAFASDELVDGNYIQDYEIFTDYYDDDDDRVLFMGDTIYVEQLSISEPVYDFYKGMIDQAYSGSPFSVPPASVPSNLTSSDGKRVLGLFSARDISRGKQLIIGDQNFTPLSSGN